MEAGCKITRVCMKTALAEHLTILGSSVSLGTPDMLTAFGTAMEIPMTDTTLPSVIGDTILGLRSYKTYHH